MAPFFLVLPAVLFCGSNGGMELWDVVKVEAIPDADGSIYFGVIILMVWSALLFYFGGLPNLRKVRLFQSGVFVQGSFGGEKRETLYRRRSGVRYYNYIFSSEQAEGAHWASELALDGFGPPLGDTRTLLVDPGSSGGEGLVVESFLNKAYLGDDGNWKGKFHISLLVLLPLAMSLCLCLAPMIASR